MWFDVGHKRYKQQQKKTKRIEKQWMTLKKY